MSAQFTTNSYYGCIPAYSEYPSIEFEFCLGYFVIFHVFSKVILKGALVSSIPHTSEPYNRIGLTVWSKICKAISVL